MPKKAEIDLGKYLEKGDDPKSRYEIDIFCLVFLIIVSVGVIVITDMESVGLAESPCICQVINERIVK